MSKVCCVQAKTLKFSPHVQLHKVTYGPKYRPPRTLATGTKKTQKNLDSFFPQNGGENYFRFRFSAIFVFSTLDLVDSAKKPQKKFRGHFFEISGVKVEKFKNILNELQEFPTRDFLIFCGRYAHLPLC